MGRGRADRAVEVGRLAGRTPFETIILEAPDHLPGGSDLLTDLGQLRKIVAGQAFLPERRHLEPHGVQDVIEFMWPTRVVKSARSR